MEQGLLRDAPAFRDLGGTDTGDGRRIRRQHLFRSEALIEPGPEDRATLSALRLRLICDLRSGAERAAWPCLSWLEPAPQSLHLALADGLRPHTDPMLTVMRSDPRPDVALEMMLCTYRHLPAAAAAQLGTLLRMLSTGHLPVLIHCSAGKDRTGFVVAMILSALGVSRELIYEDYLYRPVIIHDVHRDRTAKIMLQLTGKPLDAESLSIMSDVRRQYLDETFNSIEQHWGGLDAYLREAVGMDSAARAALRQSMLE